VEWDAVELPSQFMENWCYHKPTFLALTEHVNTKQPLPEDLFERYVLLYKLINGDERLIMLIRISKSRNYRAASMMLRQLKFGLTDLDVHTKLGNNLSPSEPRHS